MSKPIQDKPSLQKRVSRQAQPFQSQIEKPLADLFLIIGINSKDLRNSHFIFKF